MPTYFLSFQNLNLKKLFKGDIVYVDGKEATVLQSDPIRKAVKVQHEGTESSMNVWEVEESGPVEEEPPKRKRRTQNHDPISEREPAGDDKPWKAGADQLVGISGNVDFHFYFYVGESGTILTVGSLYCFDFCRDSVFICTSISKK